MKQKILFIGIFILAAISAALWFTSRSVTPAAVADATPTPAAEPAQPQQDTDKIEVLEFFWYGCPHCYSLEPYLEDWLKTMPEDVVFRRMPALLGNNWIAHARAYYTAEKLDVADKIHSALFEAIHRERIKITNEKELQDFFESQGINPDTFKEAYESEDVTEKLKTAFSLGQSYQLTGVPTIIVNRKHTTSVSKTGGNKELIADINRLIEQERQAKQGSP